MIKTIAARGFELTEPLKKVAEAELESLEVFGLDILGYSVVFTKEGKNFKTTIVMQLKYNGEKVVSSVCEDAYKSFDKASEKAEKFLRRLSYKVKNRKHVPLKEVYYQILQEKQ